MRDYKKKNQMLDPGREKTYTNNRPSSENQSVLFFLLKHITPTGNCANIYGSYSRIKNAG